MSDASNEPNPLSNHADPSPTPSEVDLQVPQNSDRSRLNDEAPVVAELVTAGIAAAVVDGDKDAVLYGSALQASSFSENDRRWWSPVVMVGISLASFLTMSGIMAVVAVLAVRGNLSLEMLKEPSDLESAMGEVLSSRLGLFLSLVIPQLALVLPCLIAAWLSPVSFRERLGLVGGKWPIWSWLAVGAASPLVGILSGLFLSLFVEESETLKEMNHVFREHGTTGFFIPLALMIGATPAFCEELLFRGYIQQRLTRSFRPDRGIFIASFLFAAFHIDLVHVLAVFPLGLFLGWVTWRSGSLFPAMIGHFVNNFVSVIGIVVAPQENQDTLGLPAAALSLSVFFFGLIGAALIGLVAYRQRATPLDSMSSETIV
jgi:membrane protease YdiL (CAAX protease family)